MSSKSRKSNHGVLRVTTAVRSKVGYVVTRHPLDLAAYELRVRTGRCFICALVQREPGSHHEIVWEDAEHIAFLNRYPTLYGYTIVAPRRHLERIERDLDKDAYLRLQSVVYAVARALEAVVDCETDLRLEPRQPTRQQPHPLARSTASSRCSLWRTAVPRIDVRARSHRLGRRSSLKARSGAPACASSARWPLSELNPLQRCYSDPLFGPRGVRPSPGSVPAGRIRADVGEQSGGW